MILNTYVQSPYLLNFSNYDVELKLSILKHNFLHIPNRLD
jgi:hypothetical protein